MYQGAPRWRLAPPRPGGRVAACRRGGLLGSFSGFARASGGVRFAHRGLSPGAQCDKLSLPVWSF